MSEQHVVCEGATVYCSLSMTNNSPATAIPLTITSQTLAVANGSKKIATNKDNTVINMCFGICNDPRVQPPSPKPPCMANVIWNKVYENATLTEAELKMLLECSEADCQTCPGGKIRVAFHGQTANIAPEDIGSASADIMAEMNPLTTPLEPALRKDIPILIKAE